MLHPTWQWAEAWIEVSDNQGTTWSPLEEYKRETSLDNTTCYIEAKTGQRFRMCFLDRRPHAQRTDLTVTYFYDGHYAQSLVYMPSYSLACVVYGALKDDTSILPFNFQGLRTTNDETLACGMQASQDVGQLRIEVWNTEVVGASEPMTITDTVREMADLFLEHHVKKKSDHQVGFAQAEAVTPRMHIDTEVTDTKPFLIFRFNYLSEALLDLNKIRPFEQDASKKASGKGRATSSREAVLQPTRGLSNALGTSSTVKLEQQADERGSFKPKDEAKEKGSGIGDVANEEELARLRAENARLRKKVKAEKVPKKASAVIDLSED